MNSLRDYQYLIAVAETLHFGKASEACHVSQPTLSGQLKKMELTMGFEFFERINRKVSITRKGKEMVSFAKKIIEAQQLFMQKARELSEPLSGELHIGLIPTLAPYLLPHIMPSLNLELEQMTFYLYEQQTEVLLEQLNDGELDALILPWLPEMQLYHSINLFDEALILAVPKGHQLNDVKNLQLSDLENQKVLTLQDGHCLRDQTLGYCFSAGAREDNSYSATSLETLRYMIAAGAGITLIPELAVLDRNDKNIVYRRFSTVQPARNIVLLTRSSYGSSLSTEKVSMIIQQLILDNHIQDKLSQVS